MDRKKEFIEFMQRSGVLTFGDFTAKSGRKTPYFVNAGNYRTGEQLAVLGNYYAQMIAESGESFEILFGPAYKGIPLAAVTAAALWSNHGINVSYSFNRKEAKDHGEGGVIVGAAPEPGGRIAIIEDVTTAGTSVRETLELVRPFGARVVALFVSVDRCERGTGEKSALREIAEEYGINVYPIVTSREIAASFPEGDGRRADMERYLAEYGAR
ncbi:MAG: orotate phosphoribosyltransferase [Oscillospiraceae bacterium]|jgi:orotate phosphoribosyltransferase|nr:orotate phosphoribosyltransferase [Oscillospiraceae bacterium]